MQNNVVLVLLLVLENFPGFGDAAMTSRAKWVP
jgi:hypothetical protein